MIQAKFGLKKLTLDKEKFYKQLEDVVVRITHEAAFEFLNAALHSVTSGSTQLHPEGYSNDFPVETGMAKGAFRPLGIYLAHQGFPDARVPIDVVKQPSRVSEGEALGRHAPFIYVSRGKDGGITKSSFSWGSKVPHFLYLDEGSNPRVKSAPWKSVETGKAAARLYVEGLLLSGNLEKRFPKIRLKWWEK